MSDWTDRLLLGTFIEGLKPEIKGEVKVSQPRTTMKAEGLLKQQPITILIDTGSTNNFMNSKVAIQMVLPIEDCSRFDVKFVDGRILKCDRRCPRVKLLLQDQEIIADFFLLPLDDCEVVLDIEWLVTLGDVF
ncbi:hypothetical protein B296_00011970 [Ensete ventricosum]|uniref:RVP_2 domain-containing protein n=1 Tax=Ensete ventricosum TaxID=4639 RepID=A0A426XRA5_ENSVE|nr:hypothetical protein B296_00011970 [Ensete ventricosum]